MFVKKKSIFVGPALFVVTLLNAQSALALEDTADVSGRMTWIIPEEVSDRYPDGQLEAARQHYFPQIHITRDARSGLFQMDVTVAPALAAGRRHLVTYRQVRDPSVEEGEMLFVNPSNRSDFVRCFESDSWTDVNCPSFTLQSLETIPRSQRRAYAENQYRGTSLGVGMALLSESAGGGEPIGSLRLFGPETFDLRPWLGSWQTRYTTADNRTIEASLSIDGFIGTYQPRQGNIRGSISDLSYFENVIDGRWTLGSATGWLRFELDGPNSFNGEWGTDDSGNALGTWNGGR